MLFTYNGQEYNKRGTTENVLFKVISADYADIKHQNPEFERAAQSLKQAELTGQQDACPIVGRKELERVIRVVWTLLPELRARQTQTGTALSVTELSGVTSEDAEYQIVQGIIAVTAGQFDEESRKNLLAKGILPLITQKQIEPDTFVFIKGIREQLQRGGSQLKAYLVKEELKPVSIKADIRQPEEVDILLKD